MQKFVWYWNRLQRMSAAEVIYRLQNVGINEIQRRGLFTAANVPKADYLNVVHKEDYSRPQINVEKYTEAADKILGGHLQIFALEEAALGEIPNWNQDPLTGKNAPLTFGKSLDYRDQELVGNIKYLWELNRHLQLVILAQAYKLSGSVRYLNGLRNQLQSWLDQCTYLQGPNWSSSLELGIRLINWSFVWRLIGGINSDVFKSEQGIAFRNCWLNSIYQHMHFIAGNFSRFSSANNHLIGESAGLFVATCIWPYWKKIEIWQDKSYKILSTEALIQNTSDGVNREQSTAYQQFVLDFMLIAALTGRISNIEFKSKYWQRIESMMSFIASIMDKRGNVPMIGDADDGYVVKLSQENNFCPFASLLATGAVLFKRGDLKRKAKCFDDKSRWLLHDLAADEFEAIKVSDSNALPVRRTFHKGGYFILGNNFETNHEVRLIIDAGPLGFLSLAAHGHADALSVMLSVGGREFLIDPGTYAYHTEPGWRNYFRGTAAHNTAVVDMQDQSEIGGNFMWVRHAKAKCIRWDIKDTKEEFEGLHNGYECLADPVIHKRAIQLIKAENKIVIDDIFECKGAHTVARYWHFSEHCKVTLANQKIIANNDGIQLSLTTEQSDVKMVSYEGATDPARGWISRRFDVKTPSPTVVCETPIKGRTHLQTEIDLFI